MINTALKFISAFYFASFFYSRCFCHHLFLGTRTFSLFRRHSRYLHLHGHLRDLNLLATATSPRFLSYRTHDSALCACFQWQSRQNVNFAWNRWICRPLKSQRLIQISKLVFFSSQMFACQTIFCLIHFKFAVCTHRCI